MTKLMDSWQNRAGVQSLIRVPNPLPKKTLYGLIADRSLVICRSFSLALSPE